MSVHAKDRARAEMTVVSRTIKRYLIRVGLEQKTIRITRQQQTKRHNFMMDNNTNLPTGHPPVKHGKTGVMLVNLGTPDDCTTAAVRKYLAEFLSDRRVIELNPLLWKPILHGIILRTRPSKVARAYEKIWLKDTDESPLRYYTRRQSELLSERFAVNDQVVVDWAMRYGSPSQDMILQQLMEHGCDRILVVPLYPQYSATTTASVTDAVSETLSKLRWQPAIRTLPPYYAHSAYINAIAATIRQGMDNCESGPDAILLSYHGLPKESLAKGDPYYCHCSVTTRLLREKLGMDESKLRMSFQSRFGPKEWLQPYTDETLRDMAANGIKSVLVVSPGFAADCLETIEEMGMENRDKFIQAGGEEYAMVPCLNDSDTGISMLHELVNQELQGWL